MTMESSQTGKEGLAIPKKGFATTEQSLATMKEGFTKSYQCCLPLKESLAKTEKSLAQLSRVLRHLLDQICKTILTTPTTLKNTHYTEKNLLYQTTLSTPNYIYYTKLHRITPNFATLSQSRPTKTIAPNYTELYLLHQTTPNFTYCIKQRLITSTTRNHTKLHLLHHHSLTTLTTPNYTYYTTIH